MSDEAKDHRGNIIGGSVLAAIVGFIVAGPVGAVVAGAAVPASDKASRTFVEGMTRKDDEDQND